MHIELVTNTATDSLSSMGRYPRELYRHLSGRVDVRLAQKRNLPLANRFSILQHFPIGIAEHHKGAVTHFTQIMGASQMIWRPTRPAVATVHDLGVLVTPHDAALFNRIDRAVIDVQYAGLKRMDHFVTDSDFTRQTVMERFRVPAERVTTVYLGVDEHFAPVEHARDLVAQKYDLQFEPDVCYLLYVGSEIPRKNIPMLLRVLDCLNNTGEQYHLLKVGSHGGAVWREQVLDEIRSRKLSDSITFVGIVPEEDLPLFYSAADVYLTTSYFEGFGWPVLEAMACGTAVVSSNAGSLAEIVGGGALTVAPDDVDGFVDAIRTLWQQDHSALRQRGFENASRFTWKNTIEALLKIYGRVT